MKNKIILIQTNITPPVFFNKDNPYATPISYPPLGLLFCGAELRKKGYKIKIIDSKIIKDVKNAIKKEISNDLLFVGITAMSNQIKEGLEYSDFIKSISNIPVVWGGVHCTLFPELTCKDKSIDFVVYGEGEETLVELAKAIENKKGFDKIKGIAYKNEGKVYVNQPREKIKNLDRLSLDFLPLCDLKPYTFSKIEFIDKPVIHFPIQTARGCPHKCTFCINPILREGYRTFSIKKVMKHLNELIKKLNINYIVFRDENFFVDRNRVIEFCKKLKDLKIEWRSCIRADYFDEKIDDSVLQLMKESGCRVFLIGAESGSDIILKKIKKDITVKQIIFSAKQCNKHGIIPIYSFIVGLPGETKKDMLKTVNLIKNLKKICPMSGITTWCFMPYPGGELYNECVKNKAVRNASTLREWTKDEFMNMYTPFMSKLSWCRYEDFVLNIVYTVELASKSNEQINKDLKSFSLLKLGQLFFVFLAKLRWKFEFFSWGIDRIIHRYIKNKIKSVK